MIKSYVSNIFVGSDRAYIYIWVSKSHKIVYVGMTNARVGTLGRASQHLDKRGTLRNNFLNSVGYNIDTTDDLILFTFKLPNKKEYTTLETSYREAVEYLVQKHLGILRPSLTPGFIIISKVRRSPRVGNSLVKKTARRIVDQFIAEYSSL
jgi:GIY-YIG catalytic domain-containing protein